MTELAVDPQTAAASSRREQVRRWAPLVLALAAVVVASLLVVPRMDVDGSPRLATVDLNEGQQIPGAQTRGSVGRNVYGFTVDEFGAGSASFTVPTPSPGSGWRTLLFVTTGGGPTLSNNLTVGGRSGKGRLIGHPSQWNAHRVDITDLVRSDRTRLTFEATNSGAAPLLIADQVRVVTYPPSAVPEAGRWEIALWVALIVLLALTALRRVRRDAPLIAFAALTAFLVWPSVVSQALDPLTSDLWDPAVHAGWFNLDSGLLSGTFEPRSSLAVQLFHALTPITGTGLPGARTASMLVGVLAVVAIYALGRRVAGLVGAVAAAGLALLSDPFRLSLSTGDSTGTLVLASCLFLIAAHYVLTRGDTRAMIALGAAGAIAILAEPLWWPGVVAAIVLLAVRQVPSGARRRALGVALLTLVLVSLPSRVSVAHQADGDANADVVRVSTSARNAEFVGRGHGAPSDAAALAADPGGGPQVGLGDYVLGDHSLSVVVGGTLSGAYDGLAAASEHHETDVFGLLAFIAELVGVVVLLTLARLRLLVLVPAMLAAVPWFYASRDALPDFLAGAAFWPALLVGGATLAHIALAGVKEWGAARRFAEPVRRRAAALAGRLPGRTQPGSP